MKSIAKFFIIGILVFAGFGYVSAQSAASSNREVEVATTPSAQVAPTTPPVQVVDTLRDRGIPTPPQVERLLQEGKVEQALNEFEKFKSEIKKANPFQLRFLEMTIYEQAQSMAPNNTKYAAKVKALKQEIIEKYPNEPDAYLLQIDNTTPADLVVELATKAIKLDPNYIEAYSQRGMALFKLGKTKEACADFEKVPWRDMIPGYGDCQNLELE